MLFCQPKMIFIGQQERWITAENARGNAGEGDNRNAISTGNMEHGTCEPFSQ